jgi:hypothetical protein
MKVPHILAAAVVIATLSAPAFADDAQNTTTPSTDTSVQRDVNQQERIEQGLQSGALTTKEAGKLEQGEAHIDKVESKDMKDGSISPEEQARLNAMQNKESTAIYSQKHDAQTGNPDSASSQRMQADVQRDVNQEQRINQGVKSGALTTQETGKLERGQARDARLQARAARNGRVNAREQRKIQVSENKRSRHIFGRKHNQKTETPATTATTP